MKTEISDKFITSEEAREISSKHYIEKLLADEEIQEILSQVNLLIMSTAMEGRWKVEFNETHPLFTTIYKNKNRLQTILSHYGFSFVCSDLRGYISW